MTAARDDTPGGERRGQTNTNIQRGETIGGPPLERKLEHCLTNIERHGFADGVDWDTTIAPAVTVEELVGALVHAEADLETEAVGGERR